MKNNKSIECWYENINRDTLGDIEQYYAKEIFFKDPFNEFVGIDKLKQLFEHMVNKLEKPRFIFKDSIITEKAMFYTWDFSFDLLGKKWIIHGSSHMKTGSDGLVIYHRDYYDVGEEMLSKIPIIKYIYRGFIKRFSLE